MSFKQLFNTTSINKKKIFTAPWNELCLFFFRIAIRKLHSHSQINSSSNMSHACSTKIIRK